MPRGKKELAEQIIPYAASVEVEVEVGRGKTVAESVKKIGVTERLTRCSRPRCSSSGGGSTTTRSGHTVPWDTGPRPQRRGSPVRSLRLRLSKRTGLVYWRAKS